MSLNETENIINKLVWKEDKKEKTFKINTDKILWWRNNIITNNLNNTLLQNQRNKDIELHTKNIIKEEQDNIKNNFQQKNNKEYSNIIKKLNIKKDIQNKENEKVDKTLLQIKNIWHKTKKISDSYLTKSLKEDVWWFMWWFTNFKKDTINNMFKGFSDRLTDKNIDDVKKIYKFWYILTIKKIWIIITLNFLDLFIILLNAIYSIFKHLFKYRVIFIIIFIAVILLFWWVNTWSISWWGKFFSFFTYWDYTYPDYLISLFTIVPIVLLVFYLELFFLDVLFDAILSFDDTIKLKLKYLFIWIIWLLLFTLFF